MYTSAGEHMDHDFSQYSQEAQRLLIKWNCMTKNMRSALTRYQQLGGQAAKAGPEGLQRLGRLFQEERLGELYAEIGRRLRSFSDTEGIEKLLPDSEELAKSGGSASFVDFKISEEALPEFDRCIDEMNELVMTLTTKLYLLRL
jgi:hypothetical protein